MNLENIDTTTFLVICFLTSFGIIVTLAALFDSFGKGSEGLIDPFEEDAD